MSQRSLLRHLKTNIIVSSAPVVVFFFVMLFSLLNTTFSYNKIVQNITEANRYSISFREQIDKTMYLVVANACSVDTLKKKVPYEENTDPYDLIDEIRTVFLNLRDKTTNPDNIQRIQMIQHDLDNLEKVCRKVEASAQEFGHYDENMRLLDLNVYILTELIQEQIQKYIFSESQAMEVLRAALYRRTILFSILFIAIFICFMVFSFTYGHHLLSNLRTQIGELKEATESVGRGDFSIHFKDDTYEELSLLSESFSKMAGEIDTLVKTTKKEQQDLRAYELRLYQAQINPHFLYNTLDTIVALVESKMPKDAILMITYLSDFFRTTLSSGRDSILIREEEKHIKSYLEIQAMRYEDILAYTIDIDDSIKNFSIPKLTLQPLVENALYHGIKGKRGKGNITVTGKEKNGEIIFCVQDDGIGMEKEKLDELTRALHEKGSKESFGLYNVEQRLILTYGERYGITFQSEKGIGTTAIVRIPAVTQTEENPIFSDEIPH